MELGPSWEAKNRLTGRECHLLLWKPKCHQSVMRASKFPAVSSLQVPTETLHACNSCPTHLIFDLIALITAVS